MKFRRIIVFSSGLAVGYLAGSAAGRERFEQISQTVAGVAEDLGLPGVSDRLRERASGVARSSADLASTAASSADDAVGADSRSACAAVLPCISACDCASPLASNRRCMSARPWVGCLTRMNSTGTTSLPWCSCWKNACWALVPGSPQTTGLVA